MSVATREGRRRGCDCDQVLAERGGEGENATREEEGEGGEEEEEEEEGGEVKGVKQKQCGLLSN